jgi:aspartate/methionine/tyrosine aminotransferase
MSLFAARTRLLGTENAFKIGPEIRALEDAGHRVLRCNIGEPDFPLPAHIRREVKRQLDLDNTHYTDPQGVLPLRQAIARHLSRTRGIRVTPDRVVVFCGAKPPIGFAQQVYVDPGDEVVYPSPGFPIYESFTRFVGAVPVPLHLRPEAGFSLAGDDLEPLVGARTKLVFLNFPSNPTGGVATEEQLEELAEVLRRKLPDDARIYSDEVYEDILFDGRRHRSIASLPGMERRTIVVSGVSKSFAWTGGRVGWAAFPTVEEAEQFKNFNINSISCLPGYNQEGARLGLESPATRGSIAEMVAAFEQRRDFVVPALRAIDGVRCALPGGAFYVFPDVGGVCARLGAIEAWESLPSEQRQATSPSTLLRRFLLRRYHVATLDRRSFGAIGAEGRHHLRISIATALEDLREAVRRIAAAAFDVDGFASFLEEESLLPAAVSGGAR